MLEDAQEMTGRIDALRLASPKQRHALAALCAGAQLVLSNGRWEAYVEERGKLLPLGLGLLDAELKSTARMLPGGAVRFVTAGGPQFAYMPARQRDVARDLLTLSMPTQLLGGPSDALAEPARPRGDRQAA